MTVDLAKIPVVVFAGGRGARFDHESQVLPKPMIEVAGKPILEHIIDSLRAQGFREFLIALGYLGSEIRQHFYLNPLLKTVVWSPAEQVFTGPDGLRISCIETGEDSHTGQRLWNLRERIDGRNFVMTYGDGLSDVDMRKLIEVHEHEQPHLGPDITVTAVNPPGRFGVIEMDPDTATGTYGQARSFDEKPRSEQWINGGFMYAEAGFIDEYIEGGFELEAVALREAASEGNVCIYRHTGFWMCMDTRRDLEAIERAVRDNGGRLPWLRTNT